MPNARLRVDGLKEAVKRTDEIGERAKFPEPALKAEGTKHDLEASERRLFESQRGWRRDSPKWAQEKRKRGLDSRVMHATGRLSKALESGTGGVVFRAKGGTLWWGIPGGRTDVFYAAPLARGVGHKKVKRRSVVLDTEARGRIAVRIERYVADGIVK